RAGSASDAPRAACYAETGPRATARPSATLAVAPRTSLCYPRPGGERAAGTGGLPQSPPRARHPGPEGPLQALGPWRPVDHAEPAVPDGYPRLRVLARPAGDRGALRHLPALRARAVELLCPVHLVVDGVLPQLCAGDQEDLRAPEHLRPRDRARRR